MKNFKKVLALVLAVVMLLSFATVASAASSASYKDVEDIDNVEAVDVLSAIGILDGFDDKTFKPDNILTRAQAAKIIAMFDNGSTDINKIYASANPFTDCVGNWAESFIAYCYKTGIIDGVGNLKFAPNSKLTGVQFLKMALVVLGYDAKAEGMTGKNWDVNTLALAKRVGLTAGFPKGYDFKTEMSRQEAAQVMLNALRADVVEYGSKLGFNSGLQWDSDKPLTLNGKVYWSVTGAVSTGKKLGASWKLEESYTSDAFYRPYRTWLLNGDEIGRYMLPTEAEYTTLFSECDLLTDLGIAKSAAGKELTYYYFNNGQYYDTYTTKHSTVNHTTDCTALDVTRGGQGSLTQVFYVDEDVAAALSKVESGDNWNAGYYVIGIETWLGTVETAKKTTVNNDGHLVTGTNATVDLFVGTNHVHNYDCQVGSYYNDAVTTAKGLSAGDYVLTTYSVRTSSGFSEGIVDIEVVTPENGKLTGYKDRVAYQSQTAVDGKYIPDSYHFHEVYADSKNVNNIGGTFGFIYDNYGNVIGMVDELGISTKYLVVDKAALTQENVFDGVIRANLVGLDANTTEKAIVKTFTKTVDGTDWTVDAEDLGNFAPNAPFFWNNVKGFLANDLATYTQTASGEYVIDLRPGTRVTKDHVVITNGLPEVKVDGDTIATDAGTVYLIHENNGSYTSVTGYKKVESLKADNVEYILGADGIADIVYVWGNIAKVGSAFTAYVANTVDVWQELVGNTIYYKGIVYVNDVATEICITADDYATLAHQTGFFKFSYTKVNESGVDEARIIAKDADLSLNTPWYFNSLGNDMIKATKHGDAAASNLALADDVVIYRITTKNTVVKADADYIETMVDHPYADLVLNIGFNAAGQVNVIYVHEDPVH